MRESQVIHLGMVNSFNVLTGVVTAEEVINSGAGIFAHSNKEEEAMESVELMIIYFKSFEMYERCARLKQYIEETFNEDGTYKEGYCDCDMPEITQYTSKIKCSICNMRIKIR